MEFMMPPDIMSIDSDISKLKIYLILFIDKIGALTPSPFTDFAPHQNNLMESFTHTNYGMQARGQPMGTYYSGYSGNTGISQYNPNGGQNQGNSSPSNSYMYKQYAAQTHNDNGFYQGEHS